MNFGMRICLEEIQDAKTLDDAKATGRQLYREFQDFERLRRKQKGFVCGIHPMILSKIIRSGVFDGIKSLQNEILKKDAQIKHLQIKIKERKKKLKKLARAENFVPKYRFNECVANCNRILKEVSVTCTCGAVKESFWMGTWERHERRRKEILK